MNKDNVGAGSRAEPGGDALRHLGTIAHRRLITKVDASAGKITIKHGPIKKFDMEDGMTMVFRAQDPAMLQDGKSRRQDQIRRRKRQRTICSDEDRKEEMTWRRSGSNRHTTFLTLLLRPR